MIECNWLMEHEIIAQQNGTMQPEPETYVINSYFLHSTCRFIIIKYSFTHSLIQTYIYVYEIRAKDLPRVDQS